MWPQDKNDAYIVCSLDKCCMWFAILAARCWEPAATSPVCCESIERDGAVWSNASCNREPAAVCWFWLRPRAAARCLQLCVSTAEPWSQHPHCCMFSPYLVIIIIIICIQVELQSMRLLFTAIVIGQRHSLVTFWGCGPKGGTYDLEIWTWPRLLNNASTHQVSSSCV